ncbi:class I SAM-dependent methyltransferase [Parabacteroides sp. AM08-6]|uniref:class I SAM-dependent methyltransferase n=1 Tax=Parabacteroides sp. AM08-6 TaxID=2292053 RepID=UPI000EFF9636|nr:class I SAM-dependent methyltransferase [Parabacteroides sp. AM08-6]RHJ79743.1 class I SAM-dependent methyltransferase [Parabacteroides sp. AM08-6]
MCKCGICGNIENNTLYVVKEMMFGYKDQFKYFKCPLCGCLQILNIPENLDKYYPSNYYSYGIFSGHTSLQSKITDFLLSQVLKSRISHYCFWGEIACLYKSLYADYFSGVSGAYLNYNSKVLDIGCGAGKLLLKMKKCGFKYLEGIDPYLKEDIKYINGVCVYKKDIYQLDKTYDFIMLHHSFEHMPEPKKVFEKLSTILSVNGMIMLRVPLVDSYAWRKYGIDWFQIDAPRHLFLHTVKSINILAQNNGLKILRTVYDSRANQFIQSEKYMRDIAIANDSDIFTSREISTFKKSADLLNSLKDGDQACFYLIKE